jgi:hypothetical protein
VLALVWVAVGAVAAFAANAGGRSPVLFYTDIESGPATGGENGDGGYVCVYGENFGAERGGARLMIGGVEAAAYKLWLDPGDPYIPGHYAKACGQVRHLAHKGAGNVQIVSAQGASNSLRFTVRDGRIFFSAPQGNDKAGDGSSGRPWRTIARCKAAMAPGDICYIKDGVVEPHNPMAVILLDSSGEAGAPKSIVAYPGAHVTAEGPARSLLTVGRHSHPAYWTIAGLTLDGMLQLYADTDMRLVDNDILCTAARCNGSAGGMIAAGGKDAELARLAFLGNRFHDVGCHDDADYRHSAHPCESWKPPAKSNSTLSTSGLEFEVTRPSAQLVTGSDIVAAGEVRRIRSVGAAGTIARGRLDEPFNHNLPSGTVYELRAISPIKLYHTVYFGFVHDLDFGWNEIDGHGQACRGLQFHSTATYDSYDLHVHDNLIHDTACDCLNFSTVDPSKGTVEAYNNVLYNCGTDAPQSMNSSYAGVYVSNNSDVKRDPIWWIPAHRYNAGELMDDDLYLQKCMKGGVSGGTRPEFSRVPGGMTTDAEVVWERQGLAHRRNGQVQFYNNTIFNAGGGGPRNWNTACWALLASEDKKNPTIGLNAVNNICLQPNRNGQSYAFFTGHDGDRSAAADFVRGTSNLFFGLPGSACGFMFSLPSNTRGCPKQLLHTFSVDPLLISPLKFNFHLRAESPIRHVGADTPRPKVDADGLSRPVKPSVGAFE